MVAASFHLPSMRFTMRTQLVESSHCYIHHLFDQPIGVTIVLWQGHDVSLFPLANNVNLQTEVSQEASVLLNNESLRLCWREALSNTSVIVSHMVRWRPWKRPKQKSFITFPCKWTKAKQITLRVQGFGFFLQFFDRSPFYKKDRTRDLPLYLSNPF